MNPDLLSLIIYLVLIVCGIALSAFLASSEAAVFALQGQDNELDAANKPDKRLLKILEEPQLLRAVFFLGFYLANISIAVLGAAVVSLWLPDNGRVYLTYTTQVLAFAFLLLVFSNISPRIVAANNSLALARKNSLFIWLLFQILKPAATGIEGLRNLLDKYLPKTSRKMTTEDLLPEPDEADYEGNADDDREIIENVIEFGSITVKEIMTSRVNIVAVSVEDSLAEVLKIIRQKRLSRMPLYENDLDNIVGILYAKDVLTYLDKEGENLSPNWKSISRKALFIPDSKRLDDLLKDFQREKTHLAVVVDEYGGTDGIVTMDDVLEEIVGDFSDDDVDESTRYTRFRSGIYIFDATINLDDMGEILGLEIATDEDDFETLGGLMYHEVESLPTVGERIVYKNLELTVHSVQNNRIKKVRVKVDEAQKQPVN